MGLPDLVTEDACAPGRPDPGEVVVKRIVCAEERVPGGDGRVGDVRLANHHAVFVIRGGDAALTLAGLGGGTVVDAAPWEGGDAILEATALVAGGWLQVDGFELLDDGVAITGIPRRLPDAPLNDDAPQAPVTVTLRLDADAPTLRWEGADGLWIQPTRPAVRTGRNQHTLWLGDTWAIAAAGEASTDLGGATRTRGAPELTVDLPNVISAREQDAVEVAGTAAGAVRVRALAGDALVGWLPVGSGGTFAGWVPADTDRLESDAPGRAASSAPPGPDVVLVPGPPATLTLDLGWRGAAPRPVRARWVSPDGRAGEALLPPTGGSLALGAGVWDVELSAGPATVRRPLRVELEADASQRVGVEMVAAFDPGERLLVATDWPEARDRGTADDSAGRAAAALARGVDVVVFTAQDDVPDGAVASGLAPFLRSVAGVSLPGAAAGRINAFPWSGPDHRAARGVEPIADLSADAVVAAAWGSDGAARIVAVAPSVLAALGAPAQVSPRPTHVLLDPPAPPTSPDALAPPDLSAWAPWFDWLNAGATVWPQGQRTWARVSRRDAAGLPEVLGALRLGALSTGSGPLVEAFVRGFGPGSVLPEGLDAMEGAVVLLRGQRPIDRLTFVADGVPVATLPVASDLGGVRVPLPAGAAWVTVVAWSTVAGDWGVSAPVFLRSPAQPDPAPEPIDPDTDPDTDVPPDTDPPQDTATPSPDAVRP